MDPFTDLQGSLRRNVARNAFHIRGVPRSYAELAEVTARIRASISANVPDTEGIVGLQANDDLATYASILALWAEGKAYVPVSSASPAERNRSILERAGARMLLSSTASELVPAERLLRTDDLTGEGKHGTWVQRATDDLAYILFTSGTTGQPKGVPITRGNLTAFVEAFEDLGIGMGPDDRCLQMFELTFDLSVMSYLIPLLKGACVYTVPKDEIKYSYIAALLEDERLTVALLVPSIINYLRPYFSEIDCPSLKHSLFCGEALALDVVQEWSACVPNACVLNVYGPTEHTIFCTHYTLSRNGVNKARNGTLSIGRAMHGSVLAVTNAEGNIHDRNAEGELCLAGPQLTPGYWNDPEKNASAFFVARHRATDTRFYRTGDLCRIDEEGDVLYLGRLDHQVKIQGFRVELAEIEHHARAFLRDRNAVAVAFPNALGNSELALFIESAGMDTGPLLEELRARLPQYMVPTHVRCIMPIPLNVNGKTDKRALEHLLRPATT